MNTTRPRTIPIDPEASRPDLEGLDWLAWLMDRSIPIPGTKLTVGLDAIIGLLPIGGDALTGMIQAGIVMVAMYRYQVPKPIVARMAANVLLDTAIGMIPFAGDLFDAGFKANTRNLALLRQVEAERLAGRKVSTAGSIAFLAAITTVLVIAVGLAVVGAVTVLAWLFRRPLV